ncbi:phage tail-collar fiber domain-containing protein [Serratia quinivorans]|uniref:phage tail-collar fiber domain-containing protein n=1 Tax=Serratia quinivorans TaxID=137545 RepID=UPI003F98AC59
MTAKFFAILTSQGAAKLANATALGTRVDLTHIAVGDGGGTLPTPDAAQTALKGEKRRAAINLLTIDPGNDSQIIAEQIIPENEGGWWIREIGLFSADGTLIAVANCPETYKPQLQEGSGRTQTIRMVLIVSSTEAVTLKIDPAVVLATRQYVDEQIGEHEKSRNHPDATLTEKGFVQLNSATDSSSEARAATPKAVKAANDNANTRLSTANNLSEIRIAGRNAQLAAQENIGLAEYGISPAVKATTGTDLNTVLTRGDSVVTNPVNGPITDAGTFFLQVRTWQSGTGAAGYRTVQEICGYGTSGSLSNRTWKRTWTGTVWGGWIEFYSEAYKPSGLLLNTRTFTASGIYKPTAGAKFIRITMTGGGGGGGGCQSHNNTETFSGAGGGAGATVITRFELSGATSYPVTIGSGGAGRTGAANGGDGGASFFSYLFSAPGGRGGGKSGVSNTAGGGGGVATTGDIRIPGGSGADGQSGSVMMAGIGGCSYFGGGGRAGAGGGIGGSAPGSGGGGAYDTSFVGTMYKGGDGASGIVIIEEFS